MSTKKRHAADVAAQRALTKLLGQAVPEKRALTRIEAAKLPPLIQRMLGFSCEREWGSCKNPMELTGPCSVDEWRRSLIGSEQMWRRPKASRLHTCWCCEEHRKLCFRMRLLDSVLVSDMFEEQLGGRW